jgi:Ala-tRNA(Pro) deacylase
MRYFYFTRRLRQKQKHGSCQLRGLAVPCRAYTTRRATGQTREAQMAISDRLKSFLQSSKAAYTTAKHSVVYTAQEIAAAQHVSGKALAKCVLVKTDKGPVLAVLPATVLIDFKKLKSAVGAKSLSLAKEADIKQAFPDVEVGAMSPFGNMYQVPVVVDRGLSEQNEVVFNGGTHTDTVKMRYRDLVTLAKARLGAFGQVPPGSSKKKAVKKPSKKGTKPGGAKRSAKKTAKKPAKSKKKSKR